MPLPTLTRVFLAALGAMLLVRLWLVARQIRAVETHRDAVPGPFADTISVDDHARAADYTVAKLKLARIELFWDAAVLLGATILGGYSSLDAGIARWNLSPLLHGVVTLVAFYGVLSIVGLPLDLYRTFGLEARFGFNRTTLATYLTDLLKSTLLGFVLGAPVACVLLALMAAAGKAWWLYGWGVWVLLSLGIGYLWPAFIAPLFNTFKPLEPGPLKDAVERIVTRCGYTADGVSIMDGSRRSGHGNAYFTGFGRHKRIVLFDTLAERLEPTEVEAVLAHELAHYRLHHVTRRLALGLALAFVGFALLGFAAHEPWIYAAFGAFPPSNAALLAILPLVAPVFTFYLTPLMSYFSRLDEYAADRYARTEANGADLARALVKLYRDNASTLTPDPVYSAWHDSHPPALARIAALQQPT